MTLRFSTNIPYGTSVVGSQTMYDFKAFMKSSSPTGPGWTVVASGDGLAAYSSSGDVITSSGSGAGGMDNTNAWFVLREPGGHREFLWQRGSSHDNWAILYSFSAHFTGGSASSRAAATDAQVIWGTTNVPASTAATTHFSTNFNSIFHFAADDADGYFFYYGGYAQSYASALPTLTSTATGALIFDELQSGTFNDGYETDPRIIYVAGGNSSNNYVIASITSETTSTQTSRCLGYLYKDTVYEYFGTIPGLAYVVNTTNVVVPSLCGMDAYTAKDIVFPMFFVKRGTVTAGIGGFKGVGKNIRFKSSQRISGANLTVNSRNDYVVIGDIALPFDGSDAQT
jgi:hypothetical protein